MRRCRTASARNRRWRSVANAPLTDHDVVVTTVLLLLVAGRPGPRPAHGGPRGCMKWGPTRRPGPTALQARRVRGSERRRHRRPDRPRRCRSGRRSRYVDVPPACLPGHRPASVQLPDCGGISGWLGARVTPALRRALHVSSAAPILPKGLAGSGRTGAGDPAGSHQRVTRETHVFHAVQTNWGSKLDQHPLDRRVLAPSRTDDVFCARSPRRVSTIRPERAPPRSLAPSATPDTRPALPRASGRRTLPAANGPSGAPLLPSR